VVFHWNSAPFWELRFELWEVEGVGPVILSRCTENLENFEDLVNFTISCEKRSSLSHLCENASSRPEINSKRVSFLAKQDFRATVPKCDHFMSVGLNGKTEGSRKTKICKFYLGS
jgi:hypothetical protein